MIKVEQLLRFPLTRKETELLAVAALHHTNRVPEESRRVLLNLNQRLAAFLSAYKPAISKATGGRDE